MPAIQRAARSRRPEWDFGAQLHASGLGALLRSGVTTLQVNVGKRCNQACHHCHVEAGPRRTEAMGEEVAEQVLRSLEASPSIDTLDITGGAPELNPNFRMLVRGARRQGVRVAVRCNLTIIYEPGQEDLPSFYREQGVDLVCSLPCYGRENVDRQRGQGVFEKSIAALRALNGLGFGMPGSARVLDLVYNPGGAFLPPPQARLEADYRAELAEGFGVHFHHLYTITNMPIRRFAAQLHREGAYERYMDLLVEHFNPATIPSLMCRTLLSVGHDGRLYDCDFNQMLDLPLPREAVVGGGGVAALGPATLFDLGSAADLQGAEVVSGSHCFGCTAGAGSSCGGALA